MSALTVDDLKPGDRIRFHDASLGAYYEGVFAGMTRPVTREGVGFRCRDWSVVSVLGELVGDRRVMSVPGQWYVGAVTEIVRVG